MSYSKELCQLVIRNIALVDELPAISEEVNDHIYECIAACVKRYLKQPKQAQYLEPCPDEDKDDASFRFKSFKRAENGKWLTYFDIWDDNEDLSWVASFTGSSSDSTAYIGFYNEYDNVELFGANKKDWKNFLKEEWQKHPKLNEAGFRLNNKGDFIDLPFQLDLDTLAEAYPDIDEDCLEPLLEALNKVIDHRTDFEAILKAAEDKFKEGKNQ